MRLCSDRRYRFDLSPAELWQRLEDVASYPTWWPWLRHFDATGLHAGDTWHCAVQPPLPYRVRFTIHLDTVEPPESIAATVGGEITGAATLTVAEDSGGSTVRLVADLGPDRRALRAMSVVFRPLVRRGHDWILDNGARQFAADAGP